MLLLLYSCCCIFCCRSELRINPARSSILPAFLLQPRRGGVGGGGTTFMTIAGAPYNNSSGGGSGGGNNKQIILRAQKRERGKSELQFSLQKRAKKFFVGGGEEKGKTNGSPLAIHSQGPSKPEGRRNSSLPNSCTRARMTNGEGSLNLQNKLPVGSGGSNTGESYNYRAQRKSGRGKGGPRRCCRRPIVASDVAAGVVVWGPRDGHKGGAAAADTTTTRL